MSGQLPGSDLCSQKTCYGVIVANTRSPKKATRGWVGGRIACLMGLMNSWTFDMKSNRYPQDALRSLTSIQHDCLSVSISEDKTSKEDMLLGFVLGLEKLPFVVDIKQLFNSYSSFSGGWVEEISSMTCLEPESTPSNFWIQRQMASVSRNLSLLLSRQYEFRSTDK